MDEPFKFAGVSVPGPPAVAQYLNQNYPVLEKQTGVDVKTDFIEGQLFTLLKQRVSALIQGGSLLNIDTADDPPLAVQGPSAVTESKAVARSGWS